MRRALLALAGLIALASGADGQSERMHYFREGWTPYSTLDGGTTLAGQWDASRPGLMVNDGAGLISSWKGVKTGLAVTATTTARGTWGATSFNSAYPGITCDGTANAYVTTTLTTIPTGATAGEIWVVAAPTTTATITDVVSYGTGSATTRQLRKNTADHPNVSDASATNLNGTSQTFTGPHIFAGQWSGTSELGWMDGTALNGNPATIATLNTGTTRFRICASNVASASAFFPGVVAEVDVFSGTLSDADRSRMFCYEAWKWGLTANLPSSITCGSPP